MSSLIQLAEHSLLGLDIGTETTCRGDGVDVDCAIVACGVGRSETVASTDTRESAVCGKMDIKTLRIEGNIIASQLHQVPLGADQGSSILAAEAAGAASHHRDSQQGKNDLYNSVIHNINLLNFATISHCVCDSQLVDILQLITKTYTTGYRGNLHIGKGSQAVHNVE